MKALNELVGSRWQGTSELWLDPMGNEAKTSPCTITIEDGVVRYSWSYDGKAQQGSYTLSASRGCVL